MLLQQVLLFITMNIPTIRMHIIILLGFFAGYCSAYLSHNCFPGCETCQVTYFFMYCTECSPGRNYNYWSGLCDCDYHSYDDGKECRSCAAQCATCDQYGCTSCSDDKYYDGFASCSCRNGKSIGPDGVCEQDSEIDLGKIIGISFGAAVGLSAVFVVVYYLRRRSEGGEIEANNIFMYRNNQVRQVALNYEMQENSCYGMITENKFTGQFKEEICSICLDLNPYFMTECGHYFHEGCIDKWLKKKNSCPNCNSTVFAQRIVKWCSKCKRQPLYPQLYRLRAFMHGEQSQIPIYWAYCRACDLPEQLIEIK